MKETLVSNYLHMLFHSQVYFKMSSILKTIHRNESDILLLGWQDTFGVFLENFIFIF